MISRIGSYDKTKFLSHFYPTTDPTEGDLVIYYNKSNPFSINSGVWPHTAIYVDCDFVKSTWNDLGSTLKHPTFLVPEGFGNAVRYYKLKDQYNSDTLLKSLLLEEPQTPKDYQEERELGKIYHLHKMQYKEELQKKLTWDDYQDWIKRPSPDLVYLIEGISDAYDAFGYLMGLNIEDFVDD